jgi:hypothetical protein
VLRPERSDRKARLVALPRPGQSTLTVGAMADMRFIVAQTDTGERYGERLVAALQALAA